MSLIWFDVTLSSKRALKLSWSSKKPTSQFHLPMCCFGLQGTGLRWEQWAFRLQTNCDFHLPRGRTRCPCPTRMVCIPKSSAFPCFPHLYLTGSACSPERLLIWKEAHRWDNSLQTHFSYPPSCSSRHVHMHVRQPGTIRLLCSQHVYDRHSGVINQLIVQPQVCLCVLWTLSVFSLIIYCAAY